MIDNLYHYNAKVLSAFDGDTIRVDIDLGCGIWKRNESIRLFGINTPEVRGPEREFGLLSRDALRDKILGKDIILQTLKDKSGKYGRLLGIIWLGDENINHWLVDNDLAIWKEY